LTLEEMEKRAVWEALERNGWRTMATARELGIDKNTLRRKIKRFGLHQSPASQL
jgi:transcriptional regulator of acetoin/glycerol metabolism